MKLESVPQSLREQAVLTIQTLAMDAVEKAKSGHPGMPMGTADLAYVLWTHYLKVSPLHPKWINRDRFVLSAGHGSMLLYALLHLTGFDLTIHDLENFRQLDSRTPGHPEFGHTQGVEATTGPLGQGCGNAVGMALAGKMLAAKFNRGANKIFDYSVFALVGDGDLMEGVSYEACSLAGLWGLDNLIFIYDDNKITIDGSTDISFKEDIQGRFEAMGWHVLKADGHNQSELSTVIQQAKDVVGKPTIIIARTHIAKGAPTKQDSASSHGSPLGAKEIETFKKSHNWTQAPFTVPDDVAKLFKSKQALWDNEYNTWNLRFEAWSTENPELKHELQKTLEPQEKLEEIAELLIQDLNQDAVATRSLSGIFLTKLKDLMPGIVAGSADLAGSTGAIFKGMDYVRKDHFASRNIPFGVREHAMGAIANGLALSGFSPVTSTFLVFSDYMRPAIRVAALSKLPSIFVLTHDSILLGEDGPTHQPIEHVPSLNLIPNLNVWRPCNYREGAVAWADAVSSKDHPTAIILTRQKVDNRDSFETSGPYYGGYIYDESSTSVPELILAATGSEVGLAMQAKDLLRQEGIAVRVVSVPCYKLFLNQSPMYKHTIFPPTIPTVAIEAANGLIWNKLIRSPLLILDIQSFGASAPDHALAEKFGFTPQAVKLNVLQWYKKLQHVRPL